MNTIRSKFLLFVLLPVIVAMLALSTLSYMSARKILYQRMLRSAQNYMRSMAESISASVQRIDSVLEVLALSEDLVKKTDEERQRLFVRLTEELGESITSVFMGFPDGRFIRGKQTPLPQDYDPRKRPWYLAALNLPPGEVGGVSEPYLDASTQKPTVTIYRKVLRDNGSLVGVLGIDVDVSRSDKSRKEDIPLPEGGILYVTSYSGIVLIDQDQDKLGKDIGDTGDELDQQLSQAIKASDSPYQLLIGKRQGDNWYAGYHRVPNSRLCAVVMAPTRVVHQPLVRLTMQIGGLALFFIIGILVLLIVIAKKISDPITDLKNSAVRVTEKGEYQDPLEVKTRDEVGQLTEAFNEMMEGLRQRDFIKDTFGRYVTKEVVEELLGTPEGLELGGEIKEVTIMFSDLRGFTPFSEQFSPEQVIDVLNRYLGKMATTIGQYQGTINEFIGDAILTIFGAPIESDDGPVRAVACAVAMQLAMEDVNRENFDRGLPALSMGIGINTGEVIVGNIGSKERAKYGVVGHNINLASRVEGSTVGGQILLAESTYEQVKDLVVIRSVLPVTFKGVEEDINLYDVAGVKEPYNLMLPDLTGDALSLPQPIPVIVNKMRGKKVALSALSGQLTHFSDQWVKVTIDEEISPPSDLRIDITGIETTDPDHIYAKVVQAAHQDDGYSHLLRISYLGPTAKNIITSAHP